ncbi:MAG TPA: glutamate-cysteine ligase family protein [Pilimelia sp.]|nr:glutamate-cysteine ligase family protein [Pilimelia sp.]
MAQYVAPAPAALAAPAPDARPITSRAHAEAHIAARAFRPGRAVRTGVELEFTVHHAADPARPLSVALLAAALGPHAPAALRPDAGAPLPAGGAVTVEPGGQVEISSAPHTDLGALCAALDADIAHLAGLLAVHGLRLGDSGLDPHRAPHRLLASPRYEAMARAFDRDGPAGTVMMRSTAGLQVCVDAGEPGEVGERWALLHLLGPPLVAAFATAGRHAGRPTGHASARMCAWLDIDPRRTAPVWRSGAAAAPPGAAWAAYALGAPLLCLRRPGGDWSAPPAVTFADWIDGALPTPPTVDDLEYHLTTLFPPVRPRGYLEVRYLDAQPPGAWFVPVLVICALLADGAVRAEAARLCAPAAGRWREAARAGLADPLVGPAARAVLRLAADSLGALTDVAGPVRRRTQVIIDRIRGTTAAEGGGYG